MGTRITEREMEWDRNRNSKTEHNTRTFARFCRDLLHVHGQFSNNWHGRGGNVWQLCQKFNF
jgi:hypothetical protein